MKLGEMADLLSGLAGALEKFMGKTAMNDLRSMSDCLRLFAEDSVSTFAKFVAEAKVGKPAKANRRPRGSEQQVDELVNRIIYLRDHPQSMSYPECKTLVEELKRLTVPAIRTVGDRVGCPVSGTKVQMLSRLETWLLNMKQSAEQSAFSLTVPRVLNP